MSRQNLSRALEQFVGRVTYARAFSSKAGVKVTPELFVHDFGTPAAAVANGICASQAITPPALGVINGSLASGGVATLDKARNVVAAWTGAAVLTITGTDQYGSIMIESSASGTTHTGTKAFKTITQISVSAAVTAFTAGSGDVLGLPYRVDRNGLLAARANNAIDAGVFVPAVTTDPATATTGDVRGTFDPVIALNGSNSVQVLLKVADHSTKIGSYGVKQFGSTDSV